MAQKAIRNIKLTDTLTLSECEDGYWLYDYTRGMNLSMKAKTKEDCFIEAIQYYQKRTKTVENRMKILNKSIDVFIDAITGEEQD